MREGRRLSQPMAEEIQRIIYAPRLALERVDCFGYLSAVNMAHLVMLVEAGILDSDAGHLIARAVLEIEEAGADGMDWDPGREDAYYNYEARLVELIGIGIGGRIHAGRSRNDIGATIDRMRTRDRCLAIGRQLGCLQEALLAGAAKYVDTVMSGYTHLQPAQPITYGFYLLGIAQALGRDRDRLRHAFETADQCPLGAGALAGTSFPIDRRRTAALLGFGGLVEHAQDAVASRDFLIDALNACVSIALTLSRLAQDLYVWSTREFGLIRLSDRIAGTSSIMPQKKNPVVLEHLKAKGALAIGQLASVLGAVRGSHFTMTIDGCRAATASAWPMLIDVEESLVLAQLVVEEVVPDSARMLDEAARNFSTTTDLADALVSEHGLSFRQAHHVVGAAIARLIDDGRDASGLCGASVNAAARAVVDQGLEISDDWLAGVLDPQRAAERRASIGGTKQAEVLRMIGDADQTRRRQDDAGDASLDRIAGAIARLRVLVQRLAGTQV